MYHTEPLHVLYRAVESECGTVYAASCGQQCAKISGTDTCSCTNGYILDTDGFACNDVDECTTSSPCDINHGTCINTDGGFTCGCSDSYILGANNICEDRDGGYTEWSTWAECSVSCGTGFQTRARTCTNPTPEGNGAPCSGDGSETRICVQDNCPVDEDVQEHGLDLTMSGLTVDQFNTIETQFRSSVADGINSYCSSSQDNARVCCNDAKNYNPTSSLLFIDTSDVVISDGYPTADDDNNLILFFVIKYDANNILCASGSTGRRRRKRHTTRTNNTTLIVVLTVLGSLIVICLIAVIVLLLIKNQNNDVNRVSSASAGPANYNGGSSSSSRSQAPQSRPIKVRPAEKQEQGLPGQVHDRGAQFVFSEAPTGPYRINKSNVDICFRFPNGSRALSSCVLRPGLDEHRFLSVKAYIPEAGVEVQGGEVTSGKMGHQLITLVCVARGDCFLVLLALSHVTLHSSSLSDWLLGDLRGVGDWDPQGAPFTGDPWFPELLRARVLCGEWASSLESVNVSRSLISESVSGAEDEAVLDESLDSRVAPDVTVERLTGELLHVLVKGMCDNVASAARNGSVSTDCMYQQ
ncbi:MLP-like protein [Mya arenaria]|uniref:MLP-like protein n=1 Tax=Mya arenaria TaxID=6604 RepID=A0ABY7FW04_MYAAR|nr:MLP-like protein [Mya arenaria]